MILVGVVPPVPSPAFSAPPSPASFVIEMLLLDLTMSSILPLLVTAVTATTVSYLLNGMDAMFAYSQVEPLPAEPTYVILLGILCGFISLYVIRVMSWLESIFHAMPQWKRFLLGVMPSVLIFFFPPLYGEGYNTINTLPATGDGFHAHQRELLLQPGKQMGQCGLPPAGDPLQGVRLPNTIFDNTVPFNKSISCGI